MTWWTAAALALAASVAPAGKTERASDADGPRAYEGPTAVAAAAPAPSSGAPDPDVKSGRDLQAFDAPGSQAPAPTDATGLAAPPASLPGEGALWIPRVIFFVPRWALDIVVHPIKLGAMAYDKYALRERAEDIFFNDERTFGVYPTGFFETGFGANGGAHLEHNDLFGQRERLRLRGGFGGLHRQLYVAKLSSGRRFRPGPDVSVEARYLITPRAIFFGIGNHDEGPVSRKERLDPFGSVAAQSRTTVEQTRATLRADQDLTPRVVLRWGQVWHWQRFRTDVRGEHRALEDLFETDRLGGFDQPTLNAYSELRVEYRGLRPASRDLFPSLRSGQFLAAYVGYAAGAAGAPSNYMRAGFDYRPVINLYKGDRLLAFRLMADTAIGAYDKIPFFDLPRLGGNLDLRGYLRDRFRDRIALLASVEYQYPVTRGLSAFFFVDGGEVASRLRDIPGAPIRLGYGGGIQLHATSSILGRLQIASSIDGGIVIGASFSSPYETRHHI